MGLPGSEMALKELLCRLLGSLLQRGVIARLADDLYMGTDTWNELHRIYHEVFDILSQTGMVISTEKTIICPKNTTILGWEWE